MARPFFRRRKSCPFSAKDAPRIEADGNLSPEEEDRLYRHYGLTNPSGQGTADNTAGTTAGTTTDTTTGMTGTGRTDRSEARGTVGRDTSGPTTDDAMTRSEEQLHVGKERREVGKARLRKYVVTENVTKTVPVQHEEVRVTREPITDANRGDALDGPAISEEEHEVVLHEERVVVDKEAVAVERVRLDTETVTEQQEVTDTVRKEQIEILDDTTNDLTDKKNKR